MDACRSALPAPGVALVIPTFNEVESIGAVVGAVSRETVDEIIVADGGSIDGTREVAVLAGARVIDAGRGYGRACLRGAEATMAGIVAFMDGDGADDPTALEALLAPVRTGACDFTIASRTRGAREPGSMAAHQVLAGMAAGGLIGLLYGVRYTDMCALRAIRRDRLMALGMSELGYGWNLEMQMRAARTGLRIIEIPVSYRRRLGGDSKVAGSLSGTLRAGSRIVATFARVALEREPKDAAGPAAAGRRAVDPGLAGIERGPQS